MMLKKHVPMMIHIYF